MQNKIRQTNRLKRFAAIKAHWERSRAKLLHKFLAHMDGWLAAITIGRKRIERCIFCDAKLNPGSEEHVFPASIGGRMRTRSATCSSCNNAFAKDDKVDDAIGEVFLIPRCALSIWTGRRQPPPTIIKAGKMPDGTDYDLGPGMVPLIRPAKIPKVTAAGPLQIVAKNMSEAAHTVNILRKQGNVIEAHQAHRITQQAPPSKLSILFEGKKLARSLSKTALAAACIVYGNINVRKKSYWDLARAARDGVPDIRSYAGWDYWNDWPANLKLTRHKNCADGSTSSFEHTVLLCDVGEHWVAYLQVFGDFRFSVQLGKASGFPPMGIALNPRAVLYTRFEVEFDGTANLSPHYETEFAEKSIQVRTGVSSSLNAVLARWQHESRSALVTERQQELDMLMERFDDKDPKSFEAAEQLMKKWVTVDQGSPWSKSLVPDE